MDAKLKVAERVDTLADDWKPEQYKDTYHETLRAAIEQKLGGREVEAPDGRWGPRLEGTPKGTIRHLVPDARSIAAIHQAALCSWAVRPASCSSARTRSRPSARPARCRWCRRG